MKTPDKEDKIVCGHLHTADLHVSRPYRASGDVICAICGKKYYDHPLEKSIVDYNDEPFLNRLCNGDLVKL